MVYVKPKVPSSVRQANLREAYANLEEAQSSIAYYGMTLVLRGLNAGEVHEWWFVGEDERISFQFWPTTKSTLDSRNRIYRVVSGWEEAMHLAIDSFFAKKPQQPK